MCSDDLYLFIYFCFGSKLQHGHNVVNLSVWVESRCYNEIGQIHKFIYFEDAPHTHKIFRAHPCEIRYELALLRLQLSKTCSEKCYL